MKYKRILLKLSGESLMGDQDYGINGDRLRDYAEEIKQVVAKNIEVAVVIGGGNIFRGLKGASEGMDRTQADHMGMLATVINGLALQSTRVDGIYTADPEKDATATRYESISFKEVYDKGLNVMDMTAFTLSKENDLPIIVFDMNKPGNLQDLVDGKKVGTLVAN